MKITVPPQDKALRLDHFLIEQFGKSRAYWKEAIPSRVRVNGRIPKKGMWVEGGEVLEWEREEESETPFAADPSLSLKVLHEDPDFIVVEKPAGMDIHPLKAEESGTLFQAVIARFPEIAGIGPSPREGGLLHRLDRDTSGLVMLARNSQAFDFLKTEFQKRRIEKEYMALVENEGVLDSKQHSIELPIDHHPKNKKKMKVDPKGRSALTFFQAVESYEGASLLKIQIPTGVRHQIRVHLAYEGFPILGDTLYGQIDYPDDIPRLFLHATRLSFRHPQAPHARIEVHCELPADFRKVLQNISATKTSTLR